MLLPADAVVAPQFLNDLSDLHGLISPNDDFLVGGGYLYWSTPCTSVDSGGPFYLRRWPLNGGRVDTLDTNVFCASTAAADETGLYYWANGTIYRRSTVDPFTVISLASSPLPTGRIILNTTIGTMSKDLFWLANNILYGVDRYTGQSVVIPGTLGNNAHSLLFSNDLYAYWFADGDLKQVGTHALFLDQHAARPCSQPQMATV